MEIISPNKIGPYLIKQTIGMGGFSTVKLAFNTETNTQCACKIIQRKRLGREINIDRFEREIRIHQMMRHKCIIGLFDLLQDSLNFYVFIEYCPNGNLYNYIVERKKIDEFHAAILLKQIIYAVKYIHSLGIGHRDLKPENIMIDENFHAKVGDFGLSTLISKDHLSKTSCGSLCYAAPEVINCEEYDPKAVDMWSVGVILFAMVTGQLPWIKRNQTQLFEQIRKAELHIPLYVSETCNDLIRGLIVSDPKKRMTVDEVLQHPFLANAPMMNEFEPKFGYLSLRRVDAFFGVDSKEDNKCLSMAPRRSNSFGSLAFDRCEREIKCNYHQMLKITSSPTQKFIKTKNSSSLPELDSIDFKLVRKGYKKRPSILKPRLSNDNFSRTSFSNSKSISSIAPVFQLFI